jgi:hypothetical protein
MQKEKLVRAIKKILELSEHSREDVHIRMGMINTYAHAALVYATTNNEPIFENTEKENNGK